MFCSRTARISTIVQKGLDHVKELGRQNVTDMLTLIEWNKNNNISFMRMSSDMFPFASHDVYGYSLNYCKPELEAVGNLAKKYNHRLTTHPGQTNNLGSPTAKVISATVRDLTYHAEMLDLMGLNQDSVMIIHMGGVYNDKIETIKRWEDNFMTLDKHVRDRIVLENDEICYNTEEILPTCEKLLIPLVFDWHHHSINPGNSTLEELLQRIAAIWKKRGIRQKMHYSESRPGAVTIMERRAHSDYVEQVPMCGGDVDLMIEAKMKEQSVLRLYQKYGISNSTIDS